MRGRGIWSFIALVAASGMVFAAGTTVEVNSATLAQLEAVGGISTARAARIVAERAPRPFADWGDAQRRLRGAGASLRPCT